MAKKHDNFQLKYGFLAQILLFVELYQVRWGILLAAQNVNLMASETAVRLSHLMKVDLAGIREFAQPEV